MPTLTVLHISDLHIGNIDIVRRDASLDSIAPGWWSLLPIFDGFLGHGYDALVALEELHDELTADGGSVQVIASGDMTASGDSEQMRTALEYLKGSLVDPKNGVGVGLGLEERLLHIIGNHDTWPGRPNLMHGPFSGVVGANPNLIDELARYPFSRSVGIPGTPASVRFVFINSDADVGDYSTKRVFARGSFVSQYQEALELLRQPTTGPCLRALVMHHSTGVDDYVLGVDLDSRIVLSKLIQFGGVSAVLCGHRHMARIQELSTIGQRATEFRCGTTTQRSEFPEHWRLAHAQAAVGLRKLEPNTALVHKISYGAGSFHWVCQVRERRRDRFEIIDNRMLRFRAPMQN